MDKIDIVITWVDGSDPEWLREKEYYLIQAGRIEDAASLNCRYRDWDNIQYIFRGIEKFMPWVNKIHFVTWGHIPSWLNTKNPKLNIVRHQEFIPSEYLPTFNSNTIELNIWRIPGLAEQYVNFNDDMFVIAPTSAEDFFKNGQPCDMACISPQPIQRNAIANIELNNLKIINDHFSIKDVLNHKWKWLNPFLYGQYAIRTGIFLQFKTIIGIFEPHIPFSHKKSVCEFIWKKEEKTLDMASRNKFRTADDVNEWLFRSWQLLSGEFKPRTPKFGQLILGADIKQLEAAIRDPKCKLICINDSDAVKDFSTSKMRVNKILDSLLPNKSEFEI